MDGALHAAFRRGAEGLSLGGQRLGLQAVPPLPDSRSGRGPRLDPGAPVGGQAVLPTLV